MRDADDSLLYYKSLQILCLMYIFRDYSRILSCDTLSIEQIKYLSEKCIKQLNALSLDQVDEMTVGECILEKTGLLHNTPMIETIKTSLCCYHDLCSTVARV